MATAALDELEMERYMSLATFRKSGEPVAVPVWFARCGDALYVFSEASAYKIKRLRRDPRVRVAACGIRGSVHGRWHDGRARIVEDTAVIERAYAALATKYGWQMSLVNGLSRLAGRIDKRAMLEIQM
jgi:PPOX class probable F420-dependent enzyme